MSIARIKNFITFLLPISSLSLVCLFWKDNLVLFILLAIIAILMLLISKSKTKLIVFLLCGFSGTIAEMAAIYFGAWQYNNSSFLDIPIWLPVLWGIAAIYILEVADFVKLNLKS